MTQLQKLFLDLQAILEAVPELNTVKLGKAKPITTDDTLPSAYIQPASEIYELATQQTSIAGYDDYIYIRVILNVRNEEDPLHYLWCKEQVIRAVLQDQPIWSGIVDRDVKGVTYDDFENDPLTSLEILFIFRIRNVCLS